MTQWLKRILLAILLMLVALLALAWYDGGREEQRLIEQPLDLANIDAGETR